MGGLCRAKNAHLAKLGINLVDVVAKVLIADEIVEVDNRNVDHTVKLTRSGHRKQRSLTVVRVRETPKPTADHDLVIPVILINYSRVLQNPPLEIFSFPGFSSRRSISRRWWLT
jgi:hypothetical protein